MEGGQWALENITPGQHTLRVSGPQGKLNLSFESGSGAQLKLNRPTVSRDLHAIVVGSSREHTKVFSSFFPAKLSLDGQPERDIGADGVDFPAMSPGAHRLALRQGEDQHTLEMVMGTVPTLSVFLASDLNVASLLVVTGEDKAQVFVNGKPYNRQTKFGQLLIANLLPKKYVVRVAKSGFQDVAEESVTLKKGQQSQLAFKLLPFPKVAGISVQGGMPGTEVLVVEFRSGRCSRMGPFTLPASLPGIALSSCGKKDLTQNKFGNTSRRE